jgi:hypothetical protein
MTDHIHTPGDSRGLRRRVLVNGKLVKHCFYADTRRGIARAFRHPYRIDKYGKRILSRTFRGCVVVQVEND